LFGLLSLLAFARVHHAGADATRITCNACCGLFHIAPLPYYLIGIAGMDFRDSMIPSVIAFVFVPTRIAMSGDTEHISGARAKIQFGLG